MIIGEQAFWIAHTAIGQKRGKARQTAVANRSRQPDVFRLATHDRELHVLTFVYRGNHLVDSASPERCQRRQTIIETNHDAAR